MILFIYGGSGSGKSEYAESLVTELSEKGQRYYIATMIAYGEEGRKRVERHRKLRQGKGFYTIECPVDLSRALEEIASPEEASVLIECVSNLTANEMFENHLGKRETAEKTWREVLDLCSRVKNAVIVSNNIFEDGMDYEEATTAYASALGMVNRRLAQTADKVIEVTAGIPAGIQSRTGESEMELVIGGFAQGKLDYVLEKLAAEQKDYLLINETSEDLEPEQICHTKEPCVIVDHLHLLIRKIADKEAACEWIRKVAEGCAEERKALYFLCDETGCGVIPLDPEARRFREDTGRILCSLAREADHVTRIFCGLPQDLK